RCPAPQQSHTYGSAAEKERGHSRGEKTIQRISGTKPADQKRASNQRAGQGCAFWRYASIGQHRRKMQDTSMDARADEEKRAHHCPKSRIASNLVPGKSLAVPFPVRVLDGHVTVGQQA